MITVHPPFEREWWVDFQQEWNRSRCRKDAHLNLTGVGIVVIDCPDNSVSLVWDIGGSLADILPYACSCTFSTFLASKDAWIRLLRGDVQLLSLLTTGELSGRIHGDVNDLIAAVVGFQEVFRKLVGD